MEAKTPQETRKNVKLKNLEVGEEITEIKRQAKLKLAAIKELQIELGIKLQEKEMVELFEECKQIRMGIDEQCRRKKQLEEEIRVTEEKLKHLKTSGEIYTIFIQIVASPLLGSPLNMMLCHKIIFMFCVF